MFCEKCGTEMKDTDKFCPKCGSANSNYQEKSGNEDSGKAEIAKTYKSKSKLLKIGIAGILLVILGLIFSKCSSSSNISIVKNGYLYQFSSEKSVGETFEERFENGKWSDAEDTVHDQLVHVYFNGYDPISEANWFVSFSYNENDTSFNIDLIRIDDEVSYTDSTELYYLISYIYNGDFDELWNDMGNAWSEMLSY